MKNLVWVHDTKPDRPGIWWMKDNCQPAAVRDTDIRWAVGTWAFICDLPTIVDPPKYREVTAADVGREVEFSDDRKFGSVEKGELLAVLPDFIEEARFFKREATSGWIHFRHARILDDGKPKREPREWWVSRKPDGFWMLCPGKPTTYWETIHVREVIDESAS